MTRTDPSSLGDAELTDALAGASDLERTAALLTRLAGELDADAILRGDTPAIVGGRWRGFCSSRRSVAAAVVVLVAAVAVPTAYAFRASLRTLIEGRPAPPAISAAFADANAIRKAQAAFDRQAHRPGVRRWTIDVAQAHGVTSLSTPEGQVDLWAAPEGGGGQCWSLELAGPSDAQQGSVGSCDSNATHASSVAYPAFAGPLLVWPLSFAEMPHLWLALVRVYSAAAVQLKLPDGETTRLPISEGFALASIPTSARTATIIATNAAGKILETRPIDQAHLVGVG